MNAEPTQAEYDALGETLLANVRRRQRRRRGVQLVAVGLSAAALAAVVTVNLDTLGITGIGAVSNLAASDAAAPHGHGAESEAQEERSLPGAADGSGDAAAEASDAVRYTVTCYADASLAADSVTIDRSPAESASISSRGVLECENVWRSGLLGARPAALDTSESPMASDPSGRARAPSGTVEAQEGLSNGPQSVEPQSGLPSALSPCVLEDGSLAVFPVPQGSMPISGDDAFCERIETETGR